MTERTEIRKEQKRLYLRLPAELVDEIHRMSAEQKRSLQGQAEYLIQEGIRAQERAAG